jgi:hypothetical protein
VNKQCFFPTPISIYCYLCRTWSKFLIFLSIQTTANSIKHKLMKKFLAFSFLHVWILCGLTREWRKNLEWIIFIIMHKFFNNFPVCEIFSHHHNELNSVAPDDKLKRKNFSTKIIFSHKNNLWFSDILFHFVCKDADKTNRIKYFRKKIQLKIYLTSFA